MGQLRQTTRVVSIDRLKLYGDEATARQPPEEADLDIAGDEYTLAPARPQGRRRRRGGGGKEGPPPGGGPGGGRGAAAPPPPPPLPLPRGLPPYRGLGARGRLKPPVGWGGRPGRPPPPPPKGRGGPERCRVRLQPLGESPRAGSFLKRRTGHPRGEMQSPPYPLWVTVAKRRDAKPTLSVTGNRGKEERCKDHLIRYG